MKKLVLFFLFIISITQPIYSQISGEIALDKRAIKDSISFKMDMEADAILIYSIVVNINGEITSCKLNRIASTQRSAKMQIMGRNRIMQGLTFEAGSRFPKFHQGIVTLSGQ